MCCHVLFYYSWQISGPLREIDKTNISCNTSQCSDAPAPAKQWLSSARLLFIFVSIIRALSYLTSQFWVPIICYPTTILHQFYIEFLKYISDARVLNLVFSRTSSTTLNFFEIAWKSLEIGINAVRDKVHSPFWLRGALPAPAPSEPRPWSLDIDQHLTKTQPNKKIRLSRNYLHKMIWASVNGLRIVHSFWLIEAYWGEWQRRW